ncbi:MAG: leucine-rich repeat protein, partial [Lachnospiraceae bacterium]|nr:leucine-rich repeat protein [Lachnospiraceae bacterium]
MAKAKSKKKMEIKKEKKISPKLAKQIRLTLGAVFLISAIVIALIPPGDIEAGDKWEEAQVRGDDNRADNWGANAYPAAIGAGTPGWIDSQTFLAKPSLDRNPTTGTFNNPEIRTSYTIYEMSAAANPWVYVDQFYYTVHNNIPGTPGNLAIINGYSDLLPADQIKLDNFLAREYYRVDERKFDEFFADATYFVSDAEPNRPNFNFPGGGPGFEEYTYSYDDWFNRVGGRVGAPQPATPDMIYIEAQEEWSDAYEAYKNQCSLFYQYIEVDKPANDALWAQFRLDDADWLAGGSVGPRPAQPPILPVVNQPGGPGTFTPQNPPDMTPYEPTPPFAPPAGYETGVGQPFIRTPADLSADKKLRFYCSWAEGLPATHPDRLPGMNFTLQVVTDQTVGGHAYIAKGGTLTGVPGTNLDNNGFLITSLSEMVIGIGDEAFRDVGNVDELLIPNEIKFIGDNAFSSSFIKEITFANITQIGNRAFRDCTQLTKITINEGARIIGAEAFYGSGLRELVLPYSINTIGLGAFAYCHSLEKIDMSAMNQNPTVIGAFAFYDLGQLNEVLFTNLNNSFDIGTGAFALRTAGQGSLSSITLPKSITGVSGNALGNYLFAGRMGLNNVIMPESYGTDRMNGDIQVPSGMFLMCTGLEFVEFPNVAGGRNGGYATFMHSPTTNANYPDDIVPYMGQYLFLDVTNPEFYVRGPEFNQQGLHALPRRSTWQAFSEALDNIPYRYIDSAGVQRYEISDGVYILQANERGELTGCQLVDDSMTGDPVDLVIPPMVGDIKIIGMAPDALANRNLRARLRSITISDNTLTSVPANAFSGLENLEWVIIGNSVEEVGANAFYDCRKLTEITFNSPRGFAHEDFVMGSGAFVTNSPRLTLNGDIHPEYAPFLYATDPVEGNIGYDDRGNPTGLRILYRSLAPDLLTVMYDMNTEEVVLLNYPKMDTLDSQNQNYIRDRQNYFYRINDKDDRRNAFMRSYIEALNPAEMYNSVNYGPWINPAYIRELLGFEQFAPAYLAAYIDWRDEVDPGEKADKSAVVNRLFEDNSPWLFYSQDLLNDLVDDVNAPARIAAIVDNIKDLKPYFEVNPYSIIENFNNPGHEAWQIPNDTEIRMAQATQNIVIPAGVTSIDAKSYFDTNPMNRNRPNFSVYFNYSVPSSGSVISQEEMTMITGLPAPTFTGTPDEIERLTEIYKSSVPGLFSGFYNGKRGNDQALFVSMSTVESLPPHAFDNCLNLQTVGLGNALNEIGIAPFRGCALLRTVIGNEKYIVEEGIIYSKKADDSFRIEQSLPARGALVGEPFIPSEKDAMYIANVSEIVPGAFESCYAINRVDLSDASMLRIIPTDCFNDSDRQLRTVRLPDSVNRIESGAFGNNHNLNVFIPGYEVHISTDAFMLLPKSTNPDIPTTSHVIWTYEGTSAYEYAKYHGETRGMGITVEVMNDTYLVDFLDHEGNNLIPTQRVSWSEEAIPPSDEIMEAYIEELFLNNRVFTGWSRAFNAIREHTTIIALTKNMEDNENRFTVTFYTYDGANIISEQRIPLSESAVEPRPPGRNGFTFTGWAPATEWQNVTRDLTVLAVYERSDAPGSSGSPNPSGSPAPGDDPQGRFTVSVSGGSGSGLYAPGAVVTIAAYAGVESRVFDRWTTASTGVGFQNATSPVTSFTMPGNNVTVTATYRNALSSSTGGGSAQTNESGGGTDNNGGQRSRSEANSTITRPGIPRHERAEASGRGAVADFF